MTNLQLLIDKHLNVKVISNVTQPVFDHSVDEHCGFLENKKQNVDFKCWSGNETKKVIRPAFNPTQPGYYQLFEVLLWCPSRA